MNEIRVYLADLLHERSRYRTFPYAAGCVGAYAVHALAEKGQVVRLELFRDPALLLARMQEAPAAVVGFSNYIWNEYLNSAVAARIRGRHDAVLVAGGPNYPTQAKGTEEFWTRHGAFDFYIPHEGELAFAGLLEALLDVDMDADRLREGPLVPGCEYRAAGDVVRGPAIPKLRDLSVLPSPYLSGLMDPFFGTGHTPLTQARRGCPFRCTFCAEGLPYYNTLGHRPLEQFRAELDYIGAHMVADAPLHLADANFGMYRQDLEFCDAIAATQARFGWPRAIEVSTGKNHKERVVEAGRRVNNAFRFLAALQTTDPQSLRNIRRDNVAEASLLDAAAEAHVVGQRSYSELILGLPGDTLESHLAGVRTCMAAGIDRIQQYPLIILPGTEMEEPEYRARFGLRTHFRPLPHCFGFFQDRAETVASTEISEIVVETDSLPHADYVRARQFQLSVELFYNDGYLDEIRRFLQGRGLAIFDFVTACHERALRDHALLSLYRELALAVDAELWKDALACREALATPEALRDYVEGRAVPYENSLGTLKARGVLEFSDPIHRVALAAGLDRLPTRYHEPYVELVEFSRLRRTALTANDDRLEACFHFAFDQWLSTGCKGLPRALANRKECTIRFWHDAGQQREICAGNDIEDPNLRALKIVFPNFISTPERLFRHCEARA
ncbi:MAG: radical SAM protein [Gammaproteobacteria bacterium]|nr:radical SAM protein [Gammaproteobacteria bacterium]